MTSRFTSTRIAAETTNVRNALLRVCDAMANAGYSPSQYTILAQTYWSPIPRGSGIRYSESGYTRQSTGGCGVWNRDADCLRQAYNGGTVKGGNCVRSANGLTTRGEPQMTLLVP